MYLMCGGMVAIMCMSSFVVSGSWCGVRSLWLIIRMMLVCASSLAASPTQWMASRVVLWSVGNARRIPFYLEDFACPIEPNSMSRLCCELYCVSWMGQVMGDE